MPGFIPGIHALFGAVRYDRLLSIKEGKEGVDGRDQPGHDGGREQWAGCADITRRVH